jgi:hypothetical protein
VNQSRYARTSAPGPQGQPPGGGGAGSLRTEDRGPEAAEIQAQEQVRTQQEGDPARQGNRAQDPGHPASGDRVQEAVEEAAAVAQETGGLGTPGRPINRRSPFMIGMTAAFGVAVTYGLVEVFVRARAVLILIGLALFIAVGLDPVVGWLVRRRVPRWAAVVTVVACSLGVMAAFLAAAIPPLSSEVSALAHQIPHYMRDLQNRNSQLGKLNARFHVQQALTRLVTAGGVRWWAGCWAPERWCWARPPPSSPC